MTERFKIDFSGYMSNIYALYVREPKKLFHAQTWKMVDYSGERQKMVDLYNSIKDLPEYLP